MRLGPTILISFRDEQLEDQLASTTYDAADRAAHLVASVNPHLTLETIDIVPHTLLTNPSGLPRQDSGGGFGLKFRGTPRFRL